MAKTKRKPKSDIALLEKRVRDFCEERDWDQFHDLKELAIGVATESSELLELFRFRSNADSEAMLKVPSKKTAIEDELSDVLFFILRISGRYDIDLTKTLTEKIRKNALKYPVAKAKGNNLKYDEL